MKRWMYVLLAVVVVAGGGFLTARQYVRATSAWVKTVSWPDPALDTVADGEYVGRAKLTLPRGTAAATSTATVRVTVRNHRYAAIEVIAPQPIAKGMTEFAQQVIAGQSLRPEAVSGATVTKTAVLMAAADAVSQR